MNYALLVIYLMSAIGIGMSLERHGKPKPTGNNNIGIDILAYLINLVLIWWAVGWKFI